MELATWLAYIGVITALIALPGPSSLLITLHGSQYGFLKSNNTIIGNVLGSFILMSLSAFGLGVVLTASDTVFSIAKYIGAAYLIYLGIKTWRASSFSKPDSMTSASLNESGFTIFKQGFLTGLSNPKDLLFFTALFPAFLNEQGPLLIQLVVLMATWLVVDYAIKVVYVMAGKKIRTQFSNPDFLSIFNRLTGGMFVMFGALLASSNK